MQKMRTLRSKYLAAFSLICLGYVILSSFLVLKTVSAINDRLTRSNLLRLAKDFESMAESNFIYFNYMNLISQAEEIRKGTPDDFIVLFDAHGKEIGFSGAEAVKNTLPSPAPWSDAQMERFTTISGRPYFLVRMPVQVNGSDTTWGYILYGFSTSDSVSANRRITGAILLVALLLSVVAILLIAWINRRLTRPIEILKQGLETISHGNFSHRLFIDSGDEFAYLGRQYNEMGQKLETMMQELEATQRDLENQVTLRTQELHQSNQKLQQAMKELQDSHHQSFQSEKQKSLTAIVSGFAHEINNPLTGIMGYVDLLTIRDDASPYVREKLLVIQKQATRIKTVIDQLNQLSPDAEQTKLNINLSNLLEKLVKVVFSKPENQGILVEKVNFEEEILVFGNHFALWQVFEGIIENAIEAIHENHIASGKLIITMKRSMDGHHAVVEVIDNGGGFRAVSKAFDPFYTTKSRTQKKGIGLSIAYNIIQEHRGKIVIGNNTTGGATVTIYLIMSSLNGKIENGLEDPQC
jgi:two-component system, NtrC family, sensor kinase